MADVVVLRARITNPGRQSTRRMEGKARDGRPDPAVPRLQRLLPVYAALTCPPTGGGTGLGVRMRRASSTKLTTHAGTNAAAAPTTSPKGPGVGTPLAPEGVMT